VQSTSRTANIIDAIVNGFGQVLSAGFESLAQLLIATLIAGPALATMLLLWLEPRAGALQRSHVAYPIASVVLSLVCGYAFAWTVSSLSQAVDAHAWVLPSAFALAAIAVILQWYARNSFSTVRAAGVAAAVLTPLTLLAIEAMF
jgi:hypothetical protein